MRLQTYLAQQGIASRRTVDHWVQQGWVKVNGQPARVGDKVENGQRLSWRAEGQRGACTVVLDTREAKLLAYHKPAGVLSSTRSHDGLSTVFEALPPCPDGKWQSVGRLDLNTSGLLLFTNVGALAHHLMHPRHGWQRVYRVRLSAELTPEHIRALTRDGVVLDDGRTYTFHRVWVRPVRDGQVQRWCDVVCQQGPNRFVRRMFEGVGLMVSRLMRLRYGPYTLDRSPVGRVWEVPVAACGWSPKGSRTTQP